MNSVVPPPIPSPRLQPRAAEVNRLAGRVLLNLWQRRGNVGQMQPRACTPAINRFNDSGMPGLALPRGVSCPVSGYLLGSILESGAEEHAHPGSVAAPLLCNVGQPLDGRDGLDAVRIRYRPVRRRFLREKWSGSPAPRTRISSAKKSPMPGRCLSSARASARGRARSRVASSRPSRAARATACNCSTLRSNKPGKLSIEASRCGVEAV